METSLPPAQPPSHPSIATKAVLLVNLGTPDEPTPHALRRYLAEFLGDPRVVELPRLLWWLILHGIILNVRPKKSAALYKSIWWEEGSPLMVISRRQQHKLQALLGQEVHVELAMRYGKPGLQGALHNLQERGVKEIVVLPLFPQYSGATSGSVYERIAQLTQHWRWVPSLNFIASWHDEPAYIKALAASIREDIARHGQPQKLLFSYHGTPKSYFDKGDPYYCFCHKTTRLVAEELGLTEEQYLMTFQSRFGREEWLKPYTDITLQELPSQGVRDVAVCCPAFVADCLETLEEIKEQNRGFFLEAGGEHYRYIPCLNERDDFILCLKELVS